MGSSNQLANVGPAQISAATVTDSAGHHRPLPYNAVGGASNANKHKQQQQQKVQPQQVQQIQSQQQQQAMWKMAMDTGVPIPTSSQQVRKWEDVYVK